jgi:TonB family protein
MNTDLLARIPGGTLLSALLRLLVPDQRSEEFVGDLVEEAHRELPHASSTRLACWLWSQTLCSLPALVAHRARRLLSAPRHPLPFCTQLTAMPSIRVHRSWPLSVALTAAAHLVAGAVVIILAFAPVEELQPTRIPVVLSALLPTRTPPAAPAAAPVIQDQAEPRRIPPARRSPRTPLPTTLVDPLPAGEPTRPADPCAPGCAGDEPPVRIPPRVAEKRCLSCPPPHLPTVFQQLGMEQQMLVRSCVNARGAVTSVDVLRGLDPTVDMGVKKTVQAWRFSPHTLDGHPVPFCYTTRFVFAMR